MSRLFHEIASVKQHPGEPRLRWWQSDYFDLFVWFEPGEEICAFQLCYDRGYDEHALTWKREFATLEHRSVDGAGGMTGGLMTPVLAQARIGPGQKLGARFMAAGETLPESVRELVGEKLGFGN